MTSQQKQELKSMFRGYTRITRAMIKLLESYGLVVINAGKHYKVQDPSDSSMFVTLAKTPSDGRTGENAAHYLIKMIDG